MGLSTIFRSTTLTTLTCQRDQQAQISCKLVGSSVFKSTAQVIDAGLLVGAKLETQTDSDNDKRYRVILLLRDRELRFTRYYDTSRKQNQRIVNQVNAFVRDKTLRSLETFLDRRQSVYLIGSTTILMGGLFNLFLLLGPVIKACHVDKRQGTVTVRKRGLLRLGKSANYAFEEIDRLELDSHYRLSLVLTSGEQVLLTDKGDATEAMRDRMQLFLNTTWKVKQ